MPASWRRTPLITAPIREAFLRENDPKWPLPPLHECLMGKWAFSPARVGSAFLSMLTGSPLSAWPDVCQQSATNRLGMCTESDHHPLQAKAVWQSHTHTHTQTHTPEGPSGICCHQSQHTLNWLRECVEEDTFYKTRTEAKSRKQTLPRAWACYDRHFSTDPGTETSAKINTHAVTLMLWWMQIDARK